MKVAIIDSGIDYNSLVIRPQISYECSIISEAQNLKIQEGRAFDSIKHGTVCIALILEYSKAADFYIIKIFDKALRISKEALSLALDICKEKDVDLINLSLGCNGEVDATIKNKISSLVSNGVAVVCANDDAGFLSWPASFPETIGVNSADCLADEIIFHNDSLIEFSAKGSLQRAKYIADSSFFFAGSSYACARMTGKIVEFLEVNEKNRLGDIKELLKRQANCSPYSTYLSNFKNNNIVKNSIKKAALFPYNKEVMSIVRYKDDLSFTITKIVDYFGKGMIKKDSGEIIGLKSNGIIIESTFDHGNKDYDTIIIGDTSVIDSFNSSRSGTNNIIEYALENDKNIFFLMEVSNTIFNKFATGKVFTPGSIYGYRDKTDDLIKSKLYQNFDLPILCVLGTGPKVGKFSVQMIVRKYLKELGYRIASVSTEPQATLFDFEGVIPIGGYDLLNWLPLHEQIALMQTMLNNIQATGEYDLVVVGGQSGVVPASRGITTGFNSLSSAMVVLASKPNYFILCASISDSVDYIIRTCQAIESFGYGKVSAIVFTDKIMTQTDLYGKKITGEGNLSYDELIDGLYVRRKEIQYPLFEILSNEGKFQLMKHILTTIT